MSGKISTPRCACWSKAATAFMFPKPPIVARGVPIVGLEPSCLLTLRDELLSLRSDNDAKTVSAHAQLFEEFLVREAQAGRLKLPLGAIAGKVLVHGHCHQKSFGAFK